MTIEKIPNEVLEDFKIQSELNETEKEALYEMVYDETTIKKENLKRGLWARCLIENDGDEKKTQTSYIKNRVKNLSEIAKINKFESLKEGYLADLEEVNEYNKNNKDNEITIEEVLEFGKKLERNKTLYNEVKEIIEWSKTLNNPERKEVVDFLQEKDDEHLNIVMQDPFEGRENFEKEDLIKAKQMINASISADSKKNLEWFKAVMWEAQLFASANPVDNDLSELISNWKKINS